MQSQSKDHKGFLCITIAQAIGPLFHTHAGIVTVIWKDLSSYLISVQYIHLLHNNVAQRFACNQSSSGAYIIVWKNNDVNSS